MRGNSVAVGVSELALDSLVVNMIKQTLVGWMCLGYAMFSGRAQSSVMIPLVGEVVMANPTLAKE
jgi:hypothetical protein